MIRLPALLLLLGFTASVVLSGCSEFKKSAEYHDIVADYDYLRGQITKTKSKKISRKKTTITPIIHPKPAIRSHCDTILRDLSQPNARVIWCIPRTAS
ncbi:MAG TPA: hypothetical protein EYP39_01945 [Ghiorsea sp.]|nr:hypothetical protein [Ghiorsea sp.]